MEKLTIYEDAKILIKDFARRKQEFGKRADEYRLERLEDARIELEKAQKSVRVWQLTVSELENLIPTEAMHLLREHERRVEYKTKCDEENNHLKEIQAAHDLAAYQAKALGKGLLCNDGHLFMGFGSCGAIVGMYLIADIVIFHFQIHGYAAALLSVIFGAVIGVIIAIALFRYLFIEYAE